MRTSMQHARHAVDALSAILPPARMAARASGDCAAEPG